MSLPCGAGQDGALAVQDLAMPVTGVAEKTQHWHIDFTGQITSQVDTSLVLGLNGTAIGSAAVVWRREERIRTLTTWRLISFSRTSPSRV
ncbi:hypothetical protein [Streptomyces celluloflavus]|uniref:hypothetical protein n=1 Tax=Streptomyces celluloflavus TaxID=58344 RepID=UPI0036B40E81